jgi:hypothetical protein
MKIIYNKNNPIGHICECGKFIKWPLYVYTHWDYEIKHICLFCEKETILFKGIIINEE